MRSLRRLAERCESVYWPTHGGAVLEPQTFVAALINHREQREARVLELIGSGTHRVSEMLPIVYRGLDPGLIPAARRSLLATLYYLLEEGQVRVTEAVGTDGFYELKQG